MQVSASATEPPTHVRKAESGMASVFGYWEVAVFAQGFVSVMDVGCDGGEACAARTGDRVRLVAADEQCGEQGGWIRPFIAG
jgi:hypothetical protein